MVRTSKRGIRWFLRRTGVGLLVLVAVVLAIVFCALLALFYSERSATRLAHTVLERIEPYEGARLEVDRLRVQRSGRIVIRGARLAEAGAPAVASVETVAVHVRWADLWARRIVVDSLRVSGPTLDLGRLLAGLATPDSAPAKKDPPKEKGKGRPFDLQVGRVVVARAQLDLTRAPEVAPLQVRDLEIRGGGLRTRPNLEVSLDSLGARLLVPGTPSPARLWVRGGLVDGIARLDTLRLDGAGSRLGARARVPLDRGLQALLVNLDIDLQADPFDAAILRPFVAVPDSGGEVRLALKAHTQGSSIEDARGDIDLDLTRARWGTLRIDGAGFALRGTDTGAVFTLHVDDPALPIEMQGRATPSTTSVPFDVVATHPAGRLQLEGGVAPKEGPTVRIARGRIDGLDLSQLSKGMPQTDLAADFTLESRGRDTRSLQLAAVLDVAPGSIGTLALEALHVDVRLASDSLHLRTEARANGARATVAGHLRPFAASKSGALRLEFASVDLARFLAGSAPHSNLSGTLDAEIASTDSIDRRMECTLALGPSRCGTETIDRALIRGSLAGKEAEATGDIALSGGRVALDVRAEPFDEPRAFELRELQFTGLDIGALLGKPALRSRLDGSASGHARLPAQGAPEWDGTFDLAPSKLAEMQIEGVSVVARQRGERLDATADLRLPGTTCMLQAHGTLGGEGTGLRAQGSLRSEDLARALGKGPKATTVALGFEAEGAALGSKDRRGTLQLDGRAAIGSMQVDSLLARVGLAGDRLRLETLDVRSNAVRVAGVGTLTLPDLLPPAGDSLAVSAVVRDPAPLAALLGRKSIALRQGSLTAVLHAAGSEAPFTAALSLDSLRVDDLSVTRVALAAQATLGPKLRVDRMTAHLAVDTLAAGQRRVRSLRAEVELDTVGVQLRSRTVVDDSTGIELALHGTPRYPGHAVLDSLNMRLGDDRWALERPVALDYGRRVTIDGFRWSSGDQSIRADGSFDADAAHALTLEVVALRLSPFTSRLGYPAYRGTLDAAGHLTGPATAPDLDANTAIRLEVENTRLDVGGNFKSTPEGLGFTAFLAAEGDSFLAHGRVPVALPRPLGAADPKSVAQAPLTAKIKATEFDIAPLAMLLPGAGIRRLEGILSADARVEGIVSAPHFQGEARLARGVVQLEALGALWENVGLSVAFKDDKLQLDSLSATTGKGSLKASGALSFARTAQRDLELHARLDRFRAPWNRAMQVQTTGTLDVTGTPTAPNIHGRLSIGESNIDITNLAAAATDVQLTEADLRMLEENFGYRVRPPKPKGPSPFEEASIDVDLQLAPNTWIRRRANPRLAIEARGGLQARKQPKEDLRLEGEIKAVASRSYVEQFGRRFEVETGTVRFDGDPAKGRVDLVANHELKSGRDRSDPDVVITVAVKGGFETPKLTLSSNPAMEEGDIVTTLLTGRPPAGTTPSGTSDDATGAASAMVAAQASGAVEDIGGDIGLDVLQVEVDGVRGATVVAGRYVNRRTYLGVRQTANFQESDSDDSSSGSSTEVEVEYEFLEWLLFNLQGGVTDVRAMMRSRYEY